MFESLTALPLWAGLIFVLLSGLGLRACRATSESRLALVLLPTLMSACSLVAMAVSPSPWLACSGLGVGAGIGYLFSNWLFVAGHTVVEQRIRVAPSAWLLPVYWLYFAWQFVWDALLGSTSPVALVAIAAGGGVCNGVIVGRATGLLKVIRAAWRRGCP